MTRMDTMYWLKLKHCSSTNLRLHSPIFAAGVADRVHKKREGDKEYHQRTAYVP